MAIIMKNGIPYGVNDAEGISYDNTQSGLPASNVQTAIDVLESGQNVLTSVVNVLQSSKVDKHGTDRLMTVEEGTKLSGIAAGAEVNVQVDWSQTTDSEDDYIKNKPTLGTAAAKDSTNAVTAGSTDLVESGAVKSAIDSAVASAYHHAGTKTVAELTSSLLIAANNGNVYNITDSGTTTSDFIEGSGKPIRIGDNVGVAKVGNEYKFDLLSGFIDTSNLIEKSQTAGLVKNDGTIDQTQYLSQHQDISGKADKVSGATNGNFAALNSNGNLTDSGKKPSDITALQTTIGKLKSDIAPVEDGNTATRSYAKNDLLVWKGDLVKTTTVIPVGGTFVLDTNIVPTTIDNEIATIRNKQVKFAFHYSENDSSPDSVTYPAGYDNSNFTDPFYVNLSNGQPHYGDWATSKAKFLFPRSCMLKYDGTRDYYLDENDETKKEDGTASDVANSSYAGNAMMEWGQDGCKIYWKIVPDQDGKGFTFVVANYQADDDMRPWNHYNCEGNVAEHFYTPKYFGSSDGTRLRSISGGTNYVNHNASDELTQAKANNLTAKEIWNTEVYCDWLLIGMLQVLLCKSMNTQSKFGKGRCKSSNSSAIGQGTMNGKGLFWGSDDETSGVKIFGMENPFGNLWRRIAGLINDSGTVKIKLTYGKEDGSNCEGYNLTGANYITHGTTGGGTSGGYISHMNITNRGITPATASGSDSTYYCDGLWFNNSQVDYAFVGGDWGNGLRVGAFCCDLNHAVSHASPNFGAALSCKPLA